MKKAQPDFVVVDLFCGAGGTTKGLVDARDTDGNQIASVIAAVNHDPIAIKSHWENHPEVKHFEEDIRKLKMAGLIDVVRAAKSKHADARLILWASLECTNFSNAKGGKPKNADSRTLANHLFRYVRAIDPDIIMIENVVEFMAWGPLDQNGKPISRKNGADWVRWRNRMCSLGYHDDWRQLNSAHFGGHTKRNRLFGAFVRNGQKVFWPDPTHSKDPVEHSAIGLSALKKWRPVSEVLDMHDDGPSIFNRRKPYVEKTERRILAGLKKYIPSGHREFISKYFGGDPSSKNTTTTEPTGSLTASCHQAIVRVRFGSTTPACSPAVTNEKFIAAYYGNGHNLYNVEEPLGSINTHDRFGLVTVKWLDMQFSQGQRSGDINQPGPSLTTVNKLSMVTAIPFLIDTQYSNGASSVDDPIGVITANGKYHYLVNPSWHWAVASADEPCPVIIARQDKAPLYVVAAIGGNMAIPVYDSDSPTMVDIKKFMAAHGLSDIRMRMLKLPELLRIQGFGDNYKLHGTNKDKKKFIGNAVHPTVPKAWIEAWSAGLKSQRKKNIAA